MRIKLGFTINQNNLFFCYIFITIIKLQSIIFQSPCIASMGTMTLKGISAEIVSSSDSITISRTKIYSLASQARNITINDVSGTMVVTDFSNISSSTTLNSSHNGVLLVSGNITLTLPEASNVLGTKYTIKKTDTSITTVTIFGVIDGKSNPQLSDQYSYITIISDGNAWYKIAENITTSTNFENQTYISNSIGMTFRLIPAGTFIMGSPSDELGHESDETQYTVTLSEPFYIQTTEVTQGQWKTVMNDYPYTSYSCGHNCPVEYITWNDAQLFLETLSSMGEGSYTLPTEAQWEYAARAGSNKAFTNGGISNTTTDSNLDLMAWYSSNSNSTRHAVAQKQANAWGLFDMHGNVWEWCKDWKSNYPVHSAIDPEGPPTATYRVLRGGCWKEIAQYCRSANRGANNPDGSGNHAGLRLIRVMNP